MKRILYTFLLGLICTVTTIGQPYDLILNSAESGTQLHQATNSIKFAAGYSYTPGGGTMIANIVSAISVDYPSQIIAGQFSADFQYTNTQNTNAFTNLYTGLATNDVFYKFTLTKEMVVTMTHCGSTLSDSYLYLLDALGSLIASNDDYTGVGSCGVAQNSFIQKKLSAGTYFVVSEGYSQNGIIQTNISGFYNEFVYPDSPSAYSSDPATVGAVAGSFGVSGTGSATFSVPVETPPGVGGMQPSLAIVYGSQSGNGVAGWGGSLSGLSAITRVPKSIYHDTEAKGLTYLGDEGYALNGQRLIYSSGTAGQEGAIYYPESDPFTKVVAHGTYTSGNCNTWFEVLDKNGMKYYYGQIAAARQTYISGSVTRVNSWYLNYVEDPLGNYMDYQYAMSSYYPYLSAITYGKNKNVSTTFENRIELVYETRPDLVPFVLEGIKGTMNKRITSITSKTGNTTFRQYLLAYANTDHFSRLLSVTEKNGSGESLKPTQFNWNFLPALSEQCNLPTVNAANVYPAVPFADQSYSAGDMNGDGITDLLSFFSSNNINYLCSFSSSLDMYGNPQFLTNDKQRIESYWAVEKTRSENGGNSLLDFDGDGTNELLVPTLTINSFMKNIRFSFYNEKKTNPYFDRELINSEEMPVYTTGDFNNDGKGDVIYMEKGHSNNQYPCEIVGFDKDSTFYRASFNLVLNDIPKKMFADDFNGDGLTDVMVFIKDNYTIFWNQGHGISAQTLDNSRKTNSSTIGNNWMIRPGDFNGDGLTDFIMNETMGSDASSTSSWYFAFGNGNGTFTKSLACTLPIFDQNFTTKDDDKFDCRVYDFDFDGKSDVVIHKAMYNKKDDPFSSPWGEFVNTRTYWMRSTGTTLTQVASATSNNESYALSKYMVTGDFNGDGKTELMNYGHNCYNGSSTTQAWRLYRNPGIVAGSGVLASVTSGYGSTTSITYVPLTKSSIYTKGSVALYPVIDITLPLAAVQSVVYDNGVAGSVTENYKYSGAKVHLQGKGFLGFQSMTTTNATTDVFTETGYKTPLNSIWFAPSETFSKTTADGKTAETTVKYTFVDKGAKKYFAYPNTKTDKDLDGNTNTTTYAFNDINGYITEEKTEYGSTNMYNIMQYGSYSLYGGKYQPQLITAISKHADDPQAFSRKTAFTYDPTKGYPLTKVENSGTTHALTTQFTSYDTFGNLMEYKVSGSGVTEITYKTEYDATNRFVSKELTNPASTQTSYIYDIWGNVTSETDETNLSNLLTTSQAYNSWGQKKSTTLSDGRKITYHTGWNNNDVTKRYFTLTQGKGRPWVKQWYDRTGRETVTESIGPKGMELKTTNTFNPKGELTCTERKQGSLTTWEDFTYDARGRLKVQSTRNGQSVTYSYGNRTVGALSNGNTTTKIFDAWGGIKSVVDPLSNVAYTYKSVGKPWTINAGGATSSMDYDEAGNQKVLTDPNAGTINYTYDAAGRVKTQVDNLGNNLEVVYDALGRIDYSTLKGIQTDYTYGTTGYDINRLTKLQTGTNSESYTYDGYGRPITEKRMIDGAGSVDFAFSYNPDGQLQTTTYPGGVQIIRGYDAYGNQVKVQSQGQTVWELTGAAGMVTTTRLGGKMTTTSTLDAQGLLSNLKTVMGNTVMSEMGYQFNSATGNLTWRTSVSAQKETFYYDQLDRINSVKEGVAEVEKMAIGYQPNGNISSKTGLGTYGYHPIKVHAVTAVANTGALIPSTNQNIGYTTFNKASYLEETVGTDAYRLDIMYGPNQQRWKSVLKKNGSDVKTIIFAGDYEKFIDNGITRELYYIGANDGLAAVYVKPANQPGSMYYAHTDHLGSIVSLTDSAGVAVFKASYDAWGKQTIATNTIGFYRGYTGHELLPEFGLINMNGRMYDPILGRFLSPDNYVQAADFSQSYNRYSYCINNPLKYTDPSGEVFGVDDAIMIAIIAYSAYNGGQAVNNGEANPTKWDWSSGSTYVGAIGGGLVGWASYGVGAEIMTSGGFMANTMGLIASSHVNSVGMMAVTGGRTDYTLNFGFGSYNFTQGEYDGLFDGEKEWSDILYGLGAMANLNDVNNLINQTKATLYTQERNADGSKDLISHSGIVEDATGSKLMSFGPNDNKIGGGGFKDQIAGSKPGAGYKKFGLAIRKGTPDYSVPVELSKSTSVTVNKHLFTGLRGISKIIPYQGVTTNCVNMSSFGLWLNGIPNIGIHPYLLHYSMAAYNSGFNPYLFNLLSTYK